MADYIKREAVLKCVAEDGRDCELDLGYWDHNIAFQKVIKEIPAADVVPVVRCKDCRYCCKEDDWEMWCMSASPACLTTPEDYCSHGRKSDG